MTGCVVPELPRSDHAVAAIAGVKLRALEATPLMVEVRLAPLNDSAFELIILTPVPATPFIVVDNVFTELVLATEFTMGAVAATPLVVLVIVFTELPSVLLLMIFTPVPAIPFIVVDKVFTELVLATEFTIGAVAATPFEVLVIVFTELLNVLVEAASTAGDKLSAALAIPLIVEVRLTPLNESALLFTIGTVAPATPLMVVDRVFAELVLPTEFTHTTFVAMMIPLGVGLMVAAVVPAADVQPFTVTVTV